MAKKTAITKPFQEMLLQGGQGKDGPSTLPVQLHEAFERSASVQNCLIYIVRTVAFDFPFFSSNLRDILGYPAEDAYLKGPAFILELMDEKEREGVLKLQQVGMQYLTLVPAEARTGIHYSMDMRLRASWGGYLTFIHSAQPYHVDGQGAVVSWIASLREITHLKRPGHLGMYVREGLRLAAIYSYDLRKQEMVREKDFTPRETEVLAALAQGLGSKEIAQATGLERTTIDLYRRRICKKTGTRDTVALLSYFQSIGLLRDRAAFPVAGNE